MNMRRLQFCLTGNLSQFIAGVDEVGRGPLAGDVVAAVVILDQAHGIKGLADSKQLTPERREELYEEIKSRAIAFAVARASVAEIDQINILQASFLAMRRAVEALQRKPDFIYVDGNRCPRWSYTSEAVVKGDSKIASIAAASILAKVTRDREMQDLDKTYPGYGLAQHKGYPTAFHLQALQELGPCAIHRRTFRPVAELLQNPLVRLSKPV
ncbi:MAG: ribonuclease HII [Pseudomonadota bacterium]